MERTAVTSSNIASIGYCEESLTLEIEFNNGGLYQYSEVPVEEFDSLMGASSHGTYFNANIKNRYPTSKLWFASW